MGNCLSASDGGREKKRKKDEKKKQRRQNSDLLPITEQGSSTMNQADSSSFVRSSQRQPSGRSEGGGGGSSTNNGGAADGRRRGGMNERNSTKESDTRSPQQRRQQRRDSTGSGTTTHSSSSQAAGSVRGSPRLGPNTRGTPKQSPALRSGSGPTSLPVPPPPPPPPRSPTTPGPPADMTIPSTTTPVLRSSASPLANATRTTTRQSPAASPLSTRSPQQHNGGDSVFTLTTGRSPQLAPRSPAGLFSTTASPNRGNTLSSSSSTIRNPLVAPPPPTTTSFIRSTPSDETTTTRTTTTTTASSGVVDGMPRSDAAASSNASSNPIASLDAQSTFSNPANTPTLNFSRHVMSPLVLPTAVNVPTTTTMSSVAQSQSTPQTNPAPPPIQTTHVHIQRRSPTTSATSPVAVVPSRGNPGTPPPSNATTVTGAKLIRHAFDQEEEDDIHHEAEKQLNMAEMVEPSASTKFGMPSSLSASTISAGTASSHASHNLPSRGDHTMQTQIFSARRRRSSGEGGSGYPAASGGLRLSTSTDQLATIASGGDVDAFSRQSSTVSGPRGSFLTMRSTTGSTTLSSLTVGAHDGLFQQRITPRQAGLRTRVASFHEVDGDTNSRHLSYSVNSGSRGSYGGRDSRGLSLEGFMLAPQLQPHNGAGGGGNSNGGVRAGEGPLGQPYSLSTHANGRTLSSELERSFDDHTVNSTSFHENLGTASLISGRSRLRSETSDWVVSPHISSGRSGGGGGGDERLDFDNISSAAATPQPVVISPVAVDTSNASNATRMRLPRFTTTH